VRLAPVSLLVVLVGERFGELALAFDALSLPADPGLTLTVYTAEPGSPAQEKLHLLASWSAMPDQANNDPGPGRT